MQIVDIFRAKIVDVGIKSLVIEVTGDGEQDQCHGATASTVRDKRNGQDR